MSNPINSANLSAAMSKVIDAARVVGRELEAKGTPTFPGVRDAEVSRIRELSGFGYTGAYAWYAVDGAACDAFWAARMARTKSN